jgi:hypothetical protein
MLILCSTTPVSPKSVFAFLLADVWFLAPYIDRISRTDLTLSLLTLSLLTLSTPFMSSVLSTVLVTIFERGIVIQARGGGGGGVETWSVQISTRLCREDLGPVQGCRGDLGCSDKAPLDFTM